MDLLGVEVEGGGSYFVLTIFYTHFISATFIFHNL